MPVKYSAIVAASTQPDSVSAKSFIADRWNLRRKGLELLPSRRLPLRAFGLSCAAVVAAAIASCAPPERNAARLAPVEALAVPSLPPWIASISPTGKADSLAQIRVIFAKPVIAVQALSAAGSGEVLRHVSIAPQLRG